MHCDQTFEYPIRAEFVLNGWWQFQPGTASAKEPANAVAFSNMAWQLEGRRFSKVLPLGKDVNAYIFEGEGDSVAVVLSKGIGHLELKQLPKELAARDLYRNNIKFPAKLGSQATFLEGKGLKAEALAAKLKSS